MSVGTTRLLQLGITTDDRWVAIRRRRAVVVICALCALAAAGFLVAEKAHELLAAKRAYAPAAESSPDVGRTSGDRPAAPAVTEAPHPVAEPPGLTVPAPVSPSTVATTGKPAGEPAPTAVPATAPAVAAPEPPSTPTILRGAGIKPR